MFFPFPGLLAGPEASLMEVEARSEYKGTGLASAPGLPLACFIARFAGGKGPCAKKGGLALPEAPKGHREPA